MKKNSRNVSTADRIRRYMSMRIPEICARCLYDRQAERSDNAEYLNIIEYERSKLNDRLCSRIINENIYN